MSEVKCSKCGYALQPAWKACPNCGQAVASPEAFQAFLAGRESIGVRQNDAPNTSDPQQELLEIDRKRLALEQAQMRMNVDAAKNQALGNFANSLIGCGNSMMMLGCLLPFIIAILVLLFAGHH